MCVHPVHLRAQTEESCRVPCGQCIECRLRRSRDWALRCMHEASLHERNCFVTLTYAEEYMPAGGSLDRRAFPLFMKRLRKEVDRVRYFHAGEYGERNGRPHYHALLFGVWFDDAVETGKSKSGYSLFESAALSELWPFGRNWIGSVSFESAQYVASYCVKKVTGDRAVEHYQRVDGNGVVYGLEPEYATMSRRPGIGAGWLDKYRAEVLRDDSVMCRGAEVIPPRFYDKKDTEYDEALMEVVKARRIRKYGERCTVAKGVTWRTNAARELIAVARLRQAQEKRR